MPYLQHEAIGHTTVLYGGLSDGDINSASSSCQTHCSRSYHCQARSDMRRRGLRILSDMRE